MGKLSGVASLSSSLSGFCALLISSEVDCWGDGTDGLLGNGSGANQYSPIQVPGIGGSGVLSGVSALSSDGESFCALLVSGAIDCWGSGDDGDLGNGSSANDNLTPAPVVTADAALSGVSALTSAQDWNGSPAYCALLTSSGVDCWGGNGLESSGGNNGREVVATPIPAVDGTGTLSDVASLASDNLGFCALLDSSEVDCWGSGANGSLGDGSFYTTFPDGVSTPVQVVGVGDTGLLTGVTALSSDDDSYCALLTTGGVDCWGGGVKGDLGDGIFYKSGHEGNAFPKQVVGLNGRGALAGVSSIDSSQNSYCVIASGAVDCWGYGALGELGDGIFYAAPDYGSAIPVQVSGVGQAGELSGADTLVAAPVETSDPADISYCVITAIGEMDCWGSGGYGSLGGGVSYQVDSPGGNPALEGVSAPVQVIS